MYALVDCNNFYVSCERVFAPALNDRKMAQYKVALALGEKKYMNTNLKTGTGAAAVLEGLSRYVEDRGYKHDYLKYQGWRKHAGRFATGVEIPQLKWTKQGLKGDSAVCMNVGWYKYTASKDEYVRIGGHWITLVGYGADREGKRDDAVLIVHDPATRAGKGPAHDYVWLKQIKSGRLTGKSSGLPCPAKECRSGQKPF